MKIVFIITNFRKGGAERALTLLASSVLKLGHEVSIFIIKPDKKTYIPNALCNAKFYFFEFTYNPFISLKNLINLIFAIKKIRPDVIHTWMYHSDFIGGIAGRIAGVTNIFWGIRSAELPFNVTSKTTILLRYFCAAFSYVVPKKIFANSKSAIDVHKGIGYSPKKLKHIPNGFDLTRYKFSVASHARFRIKNQIPIDAVIIGMIGRYDPFKNHKIFLELVANMLPLKESMYFVMAGTNVVWGNQDLIEGSNNLPRDRVILLGELNDTIDILCSLDFLILPSLAESFPNILGEAMACGSCPITADVGDCAEIMGSRALVSNANTVDAYKNLLIKYIDDPVSRFEITVELRKRINSIYSIDSIAKKYLINYRCK